MLAIVDPITWAVVATWLFNAAIMSAIAWAIGEATKKKPKLPSAQPSKFELPDIEEGRSYGVIFGTPKFIMNPTVAWWGDLSTRAIVRHYTYNQWGNNKRVYYTVGYHYSAGIHFKLCHGPIDGVKQMRVGEKVVWPNADDPMELAADGVTTINIDEPYLFGGEESEGGIVGDIDIQYGGAAQTVNSYLSSKLGSDISASRGIVSVIFKSVDLGTSPYPKPWSFLAKRTQILDDGTPQWYLAKADISGDLNAAHVLRECYTCTRWGLGNSASLIDSVAWTAAADTLYTEGFGVSRHWYDENESIEDLIKDILETIDGKIYQDPETGLFVLKLARDDYVVGSLEAFDESDIESVEGFIRPAYGEIPDIVRIGITDVLNNTTTSIPDHDIAVMDIQGGKSIISKRDFFAVTKPALGGKIAARERQQVTSMLAMMTIKGKRTMAHLRPFSVVKISYAPLGIVQLVVRVMDADYGTLQNGIVKFNCVEDVFAMGVAIFSQPPSMPQANPVSEPAAAPNRSLLETPFWTLVQDAGISGALALDADAGFLLVAAQKPSNDALDYELLVRDSPTADLIADGRGYFTPTATLAETMPLNAAEQIVDLANIVNLNQVAVNTYAMVGSEILKVTAVDITNSRVTLARGVLDTVPAAHSITNRIWFIESLSYMVGNEYTATNEPGVKILPRTAKGQYAEGSATAYNADAFDSRAIRPYPPGNLKINTVSYPSTFTGQPTLTWTHRDRTQQITELVEHDAADIGPEAGVTYTLKIYDEDNVLVRTEPGLTGTSYEYTEANELSDCGELQDQLRFVLYAVRDGYDSWQQYDITVPRRFDLTRTLNESLGISDLLLKDQEKVLSDSLALTDVATPVEG